MEPSAMKFMYPRDKQANVGFAAGLYSYYTVLNRMFRLTLTPRGGIPADISNFDKDLLVHMRPPRLPFSVSDFIWEEIKSISERPIGCVGMHRTSCISLKRCLIGSF
jgi:hypothetical protein